MPAILDQTKIVVTEEDKDSMKNVMLKRYNFETKALNLKNFASEEDLSMKCQLFRQPVLAAAADIITENIPELEALNLNENNLNIISKLVVLEQLSNLKIIYLANNKVRKNETEIISLI